MKVKFLADIYKLDTDHLVNLVEENPNPVLIFKQAPWRKPTVFMPSKDPIFIKHVLFESPGNYDIDLRFKIIRFRVTSASKSEVKTALRTWDQDRNILSLLLNKEAIQSYVPTIVKTTTTYLERWKTLIAKENIINIVPFIHELTQENIIQTIFGGVNVDVSLSSLQKKADSLPFSSDLLSPIQSFIYSLIFYHKRKSLQKAYQALSIDIIKKSLSAKETNTSIIKSLAAAYDYFSFSELDAKTAERLINTATTFTSAAAGINEVLRNLFVLLSLHPIIAEKLEAEIQEVVGMRDPCHADLEKLVYTKAVLYETIRLRAPTSNLILRNCLSDEVVHDYPVRKDDVICISSNVLQRLSKYWTNPEGFDPNRFLKPLNSEQKIIFMPFGLGVHGCIGPQYSFTLIPLILVLLIQRFRFTLQGGTDPKKLYGHEDLFMQVSKV